MSRFKKADNVDSLAGFRSDKAEATVASGLLKAARRSGHLNLSGRALTQGEVPALPHLAPLSVHSPVRNHVETPRGNVDCLKVLEIDIYLLSHSLKTGFLKSR